MQPISKDQPYLIPLLVFGVILSTFCLVLLLNSFSQPRKDQLSQPKNEPTHQTPPTQKPPISKKSFSSFLEDYEAQPQQINGIKEQIQKLIRQDYNGSILQAQKDMIASLEDKQMNVEKEGTLFLPENPSFATEKSYSQLNVPLILQKSPEFDPLHYGSNQNGSLGENGCAIASLAMVHSFIAQQPIGPDQILDWSNDDYFVENQGTSWLIFSDYAQSHGFQFYNHGNDFYSAMEAVQNGQVVIASVQPGFFTDVGHIIVIRGYKNGQVYVNDPNDNPQKMHSFKPLDESIFLTEGQNYWSFYRE